MANGGANSDSAPTTTTTTTTMETLVVVRPIKVIGMLLAVLALLLMVLSVAATSWMEANRVRKGLWQQCLYRPDEANMVDCAPSVDTDWLKACQALCIIAMILTFIGIVIVSVGLRGDNSQKKFRLYMAGSAIWFAATFFEILALIVYPVKFLEEIVDSAAAQWQFGWAYGLSWAAAILVSVGGALVIHDRNAQELVEREVVPQKESLEEVSIEVV